MARRAPILSFMSRKLPARRTVGSAGWYSPAAAGPAASRQTATATQPAETGVRMSGPSRGGQGGRGLVTRRPEARPDLGGDVGAAAQVVEQDQRRVDDPPRQAPP